MRCVGKLVEGFSVCKVEGFRGAEGFQGFRGFWEGV